MSAPLYVEALALTLAVETPIYCLLLTHFAGVRLREALVAAIVVNLVSHLLFTFVLVPAVGQYVSSVGAVLVGEVVVCALEAGLLFVWLRRDLLVVIAASLIANGCSLAAGLILFSLVPPS